MRSPQLSRLPTPHSPSWSSMGRRLLSLALFLLFPLGSATAEPRDAEFLAGLRERRLFTLAESYCRRQIEQGEFSELERAELAIEWMRTLAQHAWHAPPADRAVLWAAATEVATKFQEAAPGHPRLILVRLQDALTHLAHGELARQEAESSPERAARIKEAQDELRAALRGLEALREEAAKLARMQARDMKPPPALSAGELQSLAQNIRLQEARAYRNQAQCYAPESADWTSALQQAIGVVEPLVGSVEPDDLVWRARLEEAIDRRLLKDAEAAARIDEYLAASPPAEIRLALLAERIRVELAAGKLEQATALIAKGRTAAGQISPELDLAILETSVAQWQKAEQAKDMAGAKRWQEAAVDTASTIERLHGPYWARRAQVLLASAAGRGMNVGNLDVLVAAAENHLRLERWADAVAAYDQAAQMAAGTQLVDRSVALAMAAAAIEYRQKHLAAARDRFRQIALAVPQAAMAAGAHWNAVTCEALLAREASPPSFDLYAALLSEHLAKWPDAETSDKARWFLGRLEEDRKAWSAAAAAYRAIRPASAQAAEAATALARVHEAAIDAAEAAGKPTKPLVEQAAADLELLALGADHKAPARWSPAARAALLALARIRLRRDPTSHATLAGYLQAALTDVEKTPPDEVAELRAWLVIALAGSNRRPEAGQLLAELAQASPKQLWEVARGLAGAAKTATPAVRQELAKLELQALAAMSPRIGQLPAADRAALRRLEAEALLLAGDRAAAIAKYAELARDFASDGDTQESYARLLMTDETPAGREKALAQWRAIVQRSKPQSDRWFAAQLAIAETLLARNRKREARETIELLAARPPGLDATPLKAKFLEVLAKCR